MKKKIIYGLLVVLLCAIVVYAYLFYPEQSMPVGESVHVATFDTAKYHNDCLHPCIRYDAKSEKYYMAQSPYYAWNNKVENPMFYENDTYMQWQDGNLIADTPEKGFNSDPNICLCKDGTIYYIWREFETPLCDSIGVTAVTVGGIINAERGLSKKHILCVNNLTDGDIEQAPVMIEHKGERYIYAAWYQYEPIRKNKGVAIWKENANCTGGGMCKYQFVDTIPFTSCSTVDKCAQIRVGNYILYCPKPLYHDLWHFDLFEYGGKLYMVSVAENGDNIMLSVSEDWKRFKTFRKPLVNNHYIEIYCGYRQYYYKPTAFVKDDTLHVFYTANAKDDSKRNQLYHTAAQVEKVLR